MDLPLPFSLLILHEALPTFFFQGRTHEAFISTQCSAEVVQARWRPSDWRKAMKEVPPRSTFAGASNKFRMQADEAKKSEVPPRRQLSLSALGATIELRHWTYFCWTKRKVQDIGEGWGRNPVPRGANIVMPSPLHLVRCFHY
ncbi:hypothetical protein BCR34DRAFT_593058 [Clohesyomyces aquaticus]|uniref:Uncharacterized protein n=1 Tax=Clohesyomyces aquaticus TaxID=1231657 RepID=A0A1Y1YLK2_9PLEO|nr:hypothetical protein BCR34DRAFT_593058 [Clohesyomyces aquaticus]